MFNFINNVDIKYSKLLKALLCAGVGTRGVGWPQDLPQKESSGLRSLQLKISYQNRIWGEAGTSTFLVMGLFKGLVICPKIE